MKNIISAALLVMSVSASAAVLPGQIQVGPYLNCVVPNLTAYNIPITGVQYDFVCASPITNSALRYTPFVTCTNNCIVPSLIGNVFAGPSSANCNIVAASCFATIYP